MKIQPHGFSIAALLVTLVVIVLVSAGGWYVWRANHTASKTITQQSSSTTTTPAAGFKVSQLGVAFAVQGNIAPLYSVANTSYNNVNYTEIDFSTEQLVAKGATEGQPNACAFPATNGSPGHHILAVRKYSSAADALLVEGAHNSHLTAADLTAQNGFIALNSSVFYVPQSVEAGQGTCTNDPSFEDQQRDFLRQSLLTIHPITP